MAGAYYHTRGCHRTVASLESWLMFEFQKITLFIEMIFHVAGNNIMSSIYLYIDCTLTVYYVLYCIYQSILKIVSITSRQ